MRHVIAYDISPDEIRLAVSRVLEGVGVRVQESVFECELSGPELDALLKRLIAALGSPKAGQIRCYRVCRDCYLASFGLGEIESDGARAAYVIG